MGAFASCLMAQAGFCVTSAACNVCCRSCGLASSTATRCAYGVIFFIFTLLAWLMLTPWAEQQLSKIERFSMGFSPGDLRLMIGAMGVFRVCWAMTLFFCTMGVMMTGVQSGRDCRRGLQNGWWAIKAGLVFCFLVVAFFIPNTFFYGWSYVGIIGASVFILIQLLLLVDFAYFWQEAWFLKVHEATTATCGCYCCWGVALGCLLAPS